MDGPDLWRIFFAAIGLGIGGELIRRYRAFKSRRREMPYAERNAGIWTDRRLYRVEALFSAAACAIPFTGIVLAVWTNGKFEYVYFALIAYAIFIYLFMNALNMRERQ